MMNKTGTQRIETHRLILRPFRIEDAEDMFGNWASDPEVTRFLTWPAHRSIEVTRMLLNDWILKYRDGGFFNWAMEWKENGRVIGNISVVRFIEELETAEIGYCMSRTYWGRGIMPEALRAVTDFLFDSVGVNRVTACHDVNNPKSGRVMQKAGMKFEGIMRAAGKNNLGFCDEVRYGILRGDREEKPIREKAQVTAGQRRACGRETRGVQARLQRRAAGPPPDDLERSTAEGRCRRSERQDQRICRTEPYHPSGESLYV